LFVLFKEGIMIARVTVFVAVLLALCSAADYKQEFVGKVVLVTGGSSGIGYQTALQFAQYGAKVIIAARDSNPAWFNGTSAAQNINDDEVVKQTGGSARFVKTDVSKKEDMQALIQNIRENEKDLDICVNSAGIGGPLGPLHVNRHYINGEHDPIRNNLYGTLYSLIYELRYMNENNHTGAIINLASVNGVKATPRGSLYGTSKFGIVGLTRAAAAEHAVATENTAFVRVNAVAPTLTDTSLTWQQVKYFADPNCQPWEGDYITPDHPLWKLYGPAWISKLVCKSIATPKMMADAVLFLASSDASFITGQIFMVDRGSIA